MTFRDYTRFLAAYVANPATVGAIAPSSASLGRAMLSWIDWSTVHGVIEVGPGTGVFTEQIIAAMRPGTRFLAIERHAAFVHMLRQRFAGIRVCQDSVINVEHLCTGAGLDRVDAIISSLPWACFTVEEQTQYLTALTAVLAPHGQFATFAYVSGFFLPAGKRFRIQLCQQFAEVRTSKTVWRNLPPAFVYQCRR